MELVIEIKNKGSFPSYYRFDKSSIMIGRGYHNDIILADPYVCAAHLRIDLDEDCWVANDCSDRNPAVLSDTKAPIEAHSIQAGDELLVGKTRLRFLSPNSEIEPVRSLHKLSHPLRLFTSVSGVTGLTLVLLGMVVGQNYLSNAFEFSLEKSLGKNVFIILIPVVWAGVWALFGRILHHESRYAAHAAVTILALGGFFLLDQFSEYVGYAFSSKLMLDLFAYPMTGLLLAWLLTKNLTYATELKAFARRASAHTIAWSFLGIVFLVNLSVDVNYALSPTYMASLKPPVLHVSAGLTPTEFISQTQSMFQQDLADKNFTLKTDMKSNE